MRVFIYPVLESHSVWLISKVLDTKYTPSVCAVPIMLTTPQSLVSHMSTVSHLF